MKIEYQYIRFEKRERQFGAIEWICFNRQHGEELGIVRWYGVWRQWCYFPSVQAVYSAGCLKDLADFIGQLGGVEFGKHISSDTLLDEEADE